MEKHLEKVVQMIRKTFTTEQERNCFDGCLLYIDEHCKAKSSIYDEKYEERFKEIKEKLDTIISIVGTNGHGSKS